MTSGEHQQSARAPVAAEGGAGNERNGAWRILLPSAVSGAVALVDLDPGTAAAFRRSYPQAITVSVDFAALKGVANGASWDGRHWPLADGTLALLVADERRTDPGALAGALAPGGIRAAIVPAHRRHGVVPYPHPEALERILSPSWPATTRAPGQWLRQHFATSPLWRLTGRAGLAIDGDRDGLVDDVVADLGLTTSSPARLRGFLVSGGDNVVLRVALATEEAAVRLSLTDLGATRLTHQRQLLSGIDAALTAPTLRAHMPSELALGTTHGLAWRAETWHQGHLSPRGRRWRRQAPAWDAAHGLARLLADTAPTGRAGQGWAQSWAEEMDQFGTEVAAAVEAALGPIEEQRLTMAWCHGDLWPGNIVLSRRGAVVIDWEQARPDAPVGLDGVFLELNRLRLSSRIPIGVAAARAVRAPDALIAPPAIGGVPWVKADTSLRAALVVAAIVVHALGPKGDRRGAAWAQKNILPLLSALPGRPA
ncbi:MAG: phosphotransferase [Candidatus Dormibacteraeota bacterium]|uniref:Phosphotransferase n=1 Tax=Candidatus Amunia macphersoniae TaxID=3127014 RepID=A0A934KLE6_9BACT|nr:phosphotransferase [Candidatus Dormibacteraeota bacterium]